MRAALRIAIATASLALTASPLRAQSFSIGLRGTSSLPTGSFGEPQDIANAANVVLQSDGAPSFATRSARLSASST